MCLVLAVLRYYTGMESHALDKLYDEGTESICCNQSCHTSLLFWAATSTNHMPATDILKL